MNDSFTANIEDENVFENPRVEFELKPHRIKSDLLDILSSKSKNLTVIL